MHGMTFGISLKTAFVMAAMVISAGPALAGYADGRKAYDDGDYAAAIKNLEPLAQNGDGLAQTVVGLSYEAAGDQHDDAKATLWLVRAAQSDAVVDGKIVSFDCGDNCYLTIQTKTTQEVALCVAPECRPWNEDNAMPKALIGRKVSATIGIGEQYMDDGTFVAHMLSFRKVTVLK